MIMKRLKIAFVMHSLDLQGGAVRVCEALANALSIQHEIYFLTSYRHEPAYPLSKNVTLLFMGERKERLRQHMLARVLKYRSTIIRHRFDLVVGVDRNLIPFFPFMMMGTKIPTVLWEHMSVSGIQFVNPWYRKLLYFCSVPFLVDHVVTLNRRMCESYAKAYRLPSRRISYIYNAIDDNLLGYNHKPFNKDCKAIISVGRVVPIKGYDYLVNVASKVLAVLPDWHWDIYGTLDQNPKYAEEIKQRIDEAGLAGRINLKGACEGIYDKYQDYAFLVMTSRSEGFGMVILEAKSKNLPVISFDIDSGPSDMIRDGIDGYLVEPFDVSDMAQKILHLAQDPDLRSSMSARAAENLNKFSCDQVLSQWMSLFEKLVTEERSSMLDRIRYLLMGGVKRRLFNKLIVSYQEAICY